jgi:hypothetical protein
VKVSQPAGHEQRTINFGVGQFQKLGELEFAMLDDRTVEFTYDGKLRIVEVHAIGTSTKDGKLVMRGMQIGGTASRPLPQWTLFSLNKIEGLRVTEDVSAAPREGYAMGDSQMDTILAEIAL